MTKEENRQKAPVTSKLLDQFRQVMGQDVSIKRTSELMGYSGGFSDGYVRVGDTRRK